MAHHTLKSAYAKLTDRLNRFPQGAPPSALLYKILAMLFSEREAELVALLPIKPFTATQASRAWRLDLVSTRKVLEELAGRAILLDIMNGDDVTYALPPPMAGFFEFSMMRIRGDIDQKLLAELFYQYLNVEEDFVKTLFCEGTTRLGRTFVNESVITNDDALHVLDYERASEVITTASHIGVGMCYCRHKMEHMDRACSAPMNICMTFNTSAASLIRHGFAKRIDATECRELLHEAQEHNLVQFGENVQKRVNFICNCCGCCCEAMLAAKRFGHLNPVHTTNFMPKVHAEECTGCGICATLCPVDAMALVVADDHAPVKRKIARIDETVCLGCGVCAKGCSTGALTMNARPARVITPVDSSHRVVMMAIERGKLQDLIFDNRTLFSHRALAAILGVILKLPPIKRSMARNQLQSRFLEKMIKRHEVKEEAQEKNEG